MERFQEQVQFARTVPMAGMPKEVLILALVKSLEMMVPVVLVAVALSLFAISKHSRDRLTWPLEVEMEGIKYWCWVQLLRIKWTALVAAAVEG
jgi:hypothetical protein